VFGRPNQNSNPHFSSSMVTATAPMADSRTLLPSTSFGRRHQMNLLQRLVCTLRMKAMLGKTINRVILWLAEHGPQLRGMTDRAFRHRGTAIQTKDRPVEGGFWNRMSRVST
jgi:hypothetical protein